MKSPMFILTLFFFLGCAPTTLSDVRCQGEAETKKLAHELKAIDTKDQLQKALPRLKKRFIKLAELLVKVRFFTNFEPEEPTAASEELFAQLARLYEIPGARELIEESQREAVRLLSSNK